MNLKDYFENSNGIGVLSTSDEKCRVDSAVYARPHITDDGRAAFIMADRLTHRNLQTNPRACYLFKQEGKGYSGKRLYLKKSSETDDEEAINALRRQCHCLCVGEEGKKRYLVLFDIEKELPLVGSGNVRKNICTTCLQPSGEEGHMCVPTTEKDKKCSWCGALIVDQRHLCNKKLQKISYICNSCGRTAIKAEYLCKPEEIK